MISAPTRHLTLLMFSLAVMVAFSGKPVAYAQPAATLPTAPTPPKPAPIRPTREQLKVFRERLLKAPVPAGAGRCFSARYPSSTWSQTSCGDAPTAVNPVRAKRPDVPHPNIVGDGFDAFAVTSAGSHITRAEGSFDVVQVQAETGLRYGHPSTWQPDTYSIQLNTNSYTTPNCKSFTNCTGVTQFLYSTGQCSGKKACIFTEYWLFHPKPCPGGWNYYDGSQGGQAGCFLNTKATRIPQQSWADLQDLTMQVATGPTTDSLIVTTASGEAYLATHASVTSLAQGWTSVEYNLVGDCCSTEAIFYNGASTLQLHVALTTDSSATIEATNSIEGSFTAETNNLNLTSSSSNGSSIDFTEIGGTPAAAAAAIPCTQLQADITKLLAKIAQETVNPPVCPTGIRSICSQQIRTDEASLATLRALYAKQCHH